MKRKRYTEERIISILKEHQAGASVPDLARRHGVVENTISTRPRSRSWSRESGDGCAAATGRGTPQGSPFQ